MLKSLQNYFADVLCLRRLSELCKARYDNEAPIRQNWQNDKMAKIAQA